MFGAHLLHARAATWARRRREGKNLGHFGARRSVARCLPPSAPIDPTEGGGRMAKKALAVGVGGYGFPNDLPNGARDAEAFGSMLESIYRFDHVRVLKDGQASRESVERALDWLVQDAGPNDRLVFFFSGHGCRVERDGVIEEALVLQDGRVLDDRQLTGRIEPLPPGVFTAVLDCCFSGFDEMLVHASGEVEVTRSKRWIPGDGDRGRAERLVAQGKKAYTPFGLTKPAQVEALAAHFRAGPSLDPSPARLIALAEPVARGMVVTACLADEATAAGTADTGALSPFTHCLLTEIRRRGPNRPAFELLQATGHELRRLGFKQTPLVKEPLQPEHLGLRAFLTFQPVLSVFTPQGPGREHDDEVVRSIAEAVRVALTNIQEVRSMQPTMPGAQTFFSDPYAGGGYGWQGTHGGFGQRAPYEEISQIVGAIVPAVLANLQGRFQQPFQPWSHPQPPFGYSSQSPQLPPYDLAQIVGMVTPIVTSLIQARWYQGHFGQFMPRAA
jgi:hypothetical protein